MRVAPHPCAAPSDKTLESLVAAACERAQSELRGAAPCIAERALAWMSELSGSPDLSQFFIRPESFPMLLLPWWAEKVMREEPDAPFQADLIYSTVNGYYYIRLVDDVMDGHGADACDLLPATAFFHTQFQLGYQRHFGPAHPFWSVFTREWLRSSEAVMREASLATIGPRQFAQISAAKLCAVKIPVAAVCFRNDRPELFPRWSEFCDLLGRAIQMMDDVFDWLHDLSGAKCATYFLSEGERRRRRNESVAAWVVREGFQWGVAAVRDRFAELRAQSRCLQSPDVERYLEMRETMLLDETRRLAKGLTGFAALARALPTAERRIR